MSPHEALKVRKTLLDRELNAAETWARSVVVVELRKIERALGALGEET